ncbi:CopD family protein [Legionella erythra]|uniref:Protoporphyrinogen IX oxidase n=1 Tax=Legionella erythra TaxID=448 RepID=A0A0W0TQ96_LEGER|nr:CopD family protein [Legionella erythra]KTC97812.1 transmembrane protein [Legionella erythra]
MWFLWVKSFHIVAIVAWFGGLLYLPRLFVYHTQSSDQISIERFKIMERRLYYGIIWPAGIIATILGLILLYANWPYYLSQPWMHVKFMAVVVLWAYHLLSGHYRRLFAEDKNTKSTLYFRLFNEFPTLLLILIVVMVEVRPF